LAVATPRTPLGELTALPQTPSWFKGPASKREEEGREKGKGEKKGRGRELEGPPPFRKFLDPP